MICCKIHFSCSISLRQIQFAFRRALHPAPFGRSELLLGESGEPSFHGTWADPDLLQMLGAFVQSRVMFKVPENTQDQGVDPCKHAPTTRCKIANFVPFHSKTIHYDRGYEAAGD